ncbi:hypothetical protein HPULCUR_008601 [Helicostylum pulchrum]|uniref:Uncharacterized protein n=1 Tax=Helicostylum pulchrum TaxID=562976 RepID=A0ABP9Y839_9FUNG
MPTDKTNHFKCDADTHAMKLALASYMVNFSNMWKKSNRFYKLLNNLLQVLLKIHLVPTRERRYKDFIAQKKQEKIERHGTSQKLKVSQDHEQRSVWEEKVATCKQRILDFEENTMKERESLPSSNIKEVSEDEKAMELEVASEIELDYIEDIEDQDDEQEQLKESDLSRRRLFTLQSIIRGLLLKSGKKSEDEEEQPVVKKKLISYSNYKCMEKTENLKMDEELLNGNLCMSGTDTGIMTMTETCKLDLKKFKHHLKLYNRYDALENEEVTEEDKVMAYIPKTMKIYSKDIQYRSGGKSAQVNLLKKKKRGEQGQRIVEIEKELYESSLWTATSIDDLTNKYSKHDGYKENLRDFYYSKSMVKQRRRSKLSLQQRKFVGNKSKSIMFIGDRGYGVGSNIKGHIKYGGKWKPAIHSRYTSVRITNDHHTSQTCLFCYGKLDHPLKTVVSKNGKVSLRSIKGTFVCNNKKCLLQKLSATHKARDAVSALAIGLSGTASLILDIAFPSSDPNTSQSKTERFKNTAVAFLKRNASRPAFPKTLQHYQLTFNYKMTSVQWVYANGSAWVALDSTSQQHIESLWSYNASSWIECQIFHSPVYVDIDQMSLICNGMSYTIARRRT